MDTLTKGYREASSIFVEQATFLGHGKFREHKENVISKDKVTQFTFPKLILDWESGFVNYIFGQNHFRFADHTEPISTVNFMKSVIAHTCGFFCGCTHFPTCNKIYFVETHYGTFAFLRFSQREIVEFKKCLLDGGNETVIRGLLKIENLETYDPGQPSAYDFLTN